MPPRRLTRHVLWILWSLVPMPMSSFHAGHLEEAAAGDTPAGKMNKTAPVCCRMYVVVSVS